LNNTENDWAPKWLLQNRSENENRELKRKMKAAGEDILEIGCDDGDVCIDADCDEQREIENESADPDDEYIDVNADHEVSGEVGVEDDYTMEYDGQFETPTLSDITGDEEEEEQEEGEELGIYSDATGNPLMTDRMEDTLEGYDRFVPLVNHGFDETASEEDDNINQSHPNDEMLALGLDPRLSKANRPTQVRSVNCHDKC